MSRRPHVGRRIAAARRIARMTQQDLACVSGVSYSTVRAVERGVRNPSDAVLGALADAVDTDPSRLLGDTGPHSRVRDALPALSAAIATYDQPEDGPVRPLEELRSDVGKLAEQRLAARYLRIAEDAPALLQELARALADGNEAQRPAAARLLASAYRSADSVAYKAGAMDLSARFVELMRWATVQADDPLLAATTAYVRTETFLAARSHGAGLRALEVAVDATPTAAQTLGIAARGALHMRAAVIAARGGDADAATHHLDEARLLGDGVPEGVYGGTAFGPSSVRIHEVSVAVSLGDAHLKRALDIASRWAPPRDLPAERRSGFFIELARAQLWAGLRDNAYESLKVARKIAPQHTREHPWVQEDIATLRRIKRADREDLSNFAQWCGAV
ncbi:helix-turn-helix domain-containing protein [Streptomyces gobiensis]|uniref:helix-turn-helix domain-containing protein n=1 Tax=Streptomyces gobiensis TaxID=2875706 RepID=UPI001E3807FF|nr:helix-turn-helix transcriptional regulator [Streptomyces gobiensis]UGY91037.1 helix-turn-helix transcriptional regulator [Streptomyces gobiensis]